MMNSDCDNLDAYLAGDLTPQDAARFANHIQACWQCRKSIEQQHWVDDLLRASANDVSETPSAAMLESLRGITIQLRRRNRLIAGGFAAAAALMIAAGWIALTRPTAAPAISGIETTEKQLLQQSTFVANSNSIAIPVASPHPNVTVMRVYQTVPLPSAPQPAIESKPGTYNDNPWNVNLFGG